MYLPFKGLLIYSIRERKHHYKATADLPFDTVEFVLDMTLLNVDRIVDTDPDGDGDGADGEGESDLDNADRVS